MTRQPAFAMERTGSRPGRKPERGACDGRGGTGRAKASSRSRPGKSNASSVSQHPALCRPHQGVEVATGANGRVEGGEDRETWAIAYSSATCPCEQQSRACVRCQATCGEADGHPLSSTPCSAASRTAPRSSGPGTRSARGKARRRSASARQAGSGCRWAPRPGSRRRGSGTTAPSRATTLSRSAMGPRSRQPTQVRTGEGTELSRRLRGSPPGRLRQSRPERQSRQSRPEKRRRAGCRSASRSGARPDGRSDPPGRWPARAGSPGR